MSKLAYFAVIRNWIETRLHQRLVGADEVGIKRIDSLDCYEHANKGYQLCRRLARDKHSVVLEARYIAQGSLSSLLQVQ